MKKFFDDGTTQVLQDELARQWRRDVCINWLLAGFIASVTAIYFIWVL